MNFREVVACIEWGPSDAPFRLEHQTRSRAAATLTTPHGQVLDLGIEEWRQLALAIHRMFPAERDRSLRTDAANIGKPWSAELDSELAQRWNAGSDVAALAAHFGRAKGGITARLVRLGLVPDRATASSRPTANGGHDMSVREQ
jgi:hypothetical protein